MRSILFNWREVEEAIKRENIDQAFASISQALAHHLQLRQVIPQRERQLSDQLKIYFERGLGSRDHSERLKLKFIRTLAFHPSLGDRKIQIVINQYLEIL